MSFFSRARLNPRALPNQETLKAAMAGDVYLDHALVWRLFPGDGRARDFLFRVERDETDKPVYYIVSQRPPQPIAGLFSVDTKKYVPHLHEGEMLRFDLRANPTIAVSEADARQPKRHDVLMHAKRNAKAEGNVEVGDKMDVAALAWLTKRAGAWGLEIVPQSVAIECYAQHRLRHKGRSIEFSSVDYRGVAKVLDPGKLLIALTRGVGRAKGFGCGLLLIKRLD